MSHWSLYVIRAADASLYTGITTDVARRFGEHCAGRGARYLKGRAPLELVYHRVLGNRSLALQAEYAFKQLDRMAKQQLIRSAPDAGALLDTLLPDRPRGQDNGLNHAGQEAEQT